MPHHCASWRYEFSRLPACLPRSLADQCYRHWPMGRMSKEEAAVAAAVARAVQDVKGEVKRLEVALTEAKSKVAEQEKEMAMLRTNASADRSGRDAAQKELAKWKAEHGPIPKITSRSVRDRCADELCREMQRFDATDIIPLVMSALVKLEKHHGQPLIAEIRNAHQFAPVIREMNAARDAQVATHLREHSFFDDAFSLLRLVCKLSLRECHLIEQSFKWEHHPNGTKSRRMLMTDSKEPAPLIFNVAGIKASEQRAMDSSKLLLHEHTDGRGADVSGKPGGVDQAIFNGLQSTRGDRTGGMATAGTEEDPHLVNLSGDGAGLSDAYSGII